MKRIRIALVACLAGLLAVACEKENESQTQEYSTNIFKIDVASFVDNNNNKVFLQYGDPSKLLYEDGDKIKITSNHGVSRDYILKYRTTSDGLTPAVTQNGWYAQSDDTLGGSVFYAAFVDGYNVYSTVLTGNGPSYSFNLNPIVGDHPDRNKMILTGSTENNEGGSVITLNPACAILRLKTNGAPMTYVKVGFSGNKIPKRGVLNASDVTITASEYLSGVTSGGAGQFLYMRPCDASEGENEYWYVAIPISGTDVTTTLYLEWNNGSATTQYKTSGEVTLVPGRVYTVGTERSVPFTAKGFTKSYFATPNNHAVAFSAGNLQGRTRFIAGTGEVDDWQFAPTQFTTLGNANIASGLRRNAYFDLFGYGTSGNSAHPNLASTSNDDYPSGTIDGTADEWGHKNYNAPGIKYGSTTVTDIPWSTLTRDEWSFIINNRPGKVGLATITIDGHAYEGLVLLPDYDEYGGEWSMPEGVSFNASISSYTANDYTDSEWAILENNGVVFLPVTSYRLGESSLTDAQMGYYWTSTGGAGTPQNNSYALKINAGSVSVISKVRVHGCAVRLVYRVW